MNDSSEQVQPLNRERHFLKKQSTANDKTGMRNLFLRFFIVILIANIMTAFLTFYRYEADAHQPSEWQTVKRPAGAIRLLGHCRYLP
jgi:flagellar basal body-associated protein FliL